MTLLDHYREPLQIQPSRIRELTLCFRINVDKSNEVAPNNNFKHHSLRCPGPQWGQNLHSREDLRVCNRHVLFSTRNLS